MLISVIVGSLPICIVIGRQRAQESQENNTWWEKDSIETRAAATLMNQVFLQSGLHLETVSGAAVKICISDKAVGAAHVQQRRK